MNKIFAGGLLLVAVAAAAQEDVVVITATRAPRPSLEIPASVDRLYAEFVNEGNRSHQAPMDAFWGPRYAIVEDPDGYLLGLKSPR